MPARTQSISSKAELGPLFTSLVLTLIGILLIYSSGRLEFSSAYIHLYRKQLVWFLVALAVSYPFMRVDMKVLGRVSYLLYAVSIITLLVVLALPGSGPHRWIRLGSFQFQPSELAKLFTVLALARYLSARKRRLERLTDFAIPILIAGVPTALILVEPDLGTAAVFIPVLFAMLFWAGARPLYLLLLASPMISFAASSSTLVFTLFLVFLVTVIHRRKPFFFDAAVVVGTNLGVGLLYKTFWNSLELYQKKRLLAFLGLESDPLGIDWQKIQSQVAIGSGGFWGKGLLEGTQKKLAFLPEQHTDFIFSIAGEETGFLGVIIILLLYYFLLVRGLQIARHAPTAYSSLVAMGIVTLIFIHVFVNITMVTGFLPVIGLPLPFLSYGGSSLVMFFITIALLERVSFERMYQWMR